MCQCARVCIRDCSSSQRRVEPRCSRRHPGSHLPPLPAPCPPAQAAVYQNIHVKYNKQYAEVLYMEMANTDLDKYYKVGRARVPFFIFQNLITI